jgi:hypothetical protein
METQTITLSLPRNILRQVEFIAASRNISVDSLLMQALEQIVQEEDAYSQARQSHLRWLDQGANLGTGGQLIIKRDEIHERS